MSFQPPVPVEKVLKEIHRRAYVLPAIQREFVWSTEQIRMLFDSLLPGYPIGSFLFWTVEALQATQFTFYDFIRDYHEKDNPYAPAITIPHGQGVVAILNGQQAVRETLGGALAMLIDGLGTWLDVQIENAQEFSAELRRAVD